MTRTARSTPEATMRALENVLARIRRDQEQRALERAVDAADEAMQRELLALAHARGIAVHGRNWR